VEVSESLRAETPPPAPACPDAPKSAQSGFSFFSSPLFPFTPDLRLRQLRSDTSPAVPPKSLAGLAVNGPFRTKLQLYSLRSLFHYSACLVRRLFSRVPPDSLVMRRPVSERCCRASAPAKDCFESPNTYHFLRGFLMPFILLTSFGHYPVAYAFPNGWEVLFVSPLRLSTRLPGAFALPPLLLFFTTISAASDRFLER